LAANGFSILRLTPRDAGVLGNVVEDVFDGSVSPADAAAFLPAPGHALFVALADAVVVGQIRGLVHVQPDGPSQLYIDNLGVAPGEQRKGAATALIRALLAWGREQGCVACWVATETDNEEARAFYSAVDLREKALAWFETDLADETSSP
jgi:aminoglycoside 6'-N-acetyltransferase I